ncbi:hypothetical protein [Bradyrhizobium roseum]|uniref:hypothetical protein n=1 Tax=Bradyrhizobium roseum TaxID=3056648 RepID=UPI002627D037|nr:hypothetical protein [Bradyrhizobium roseus]WKA31622.1 hypothetical protein QUH67_16310 [Bradyrhizobium roseus]
MIQPAPGRIVWFFPALEVGRDPNGQPLAAMVAKVLGERCVNLTVSHGDGTTYAAQNVQLLQDDDAEPETAYACWMPFQKGQAARHETPAVPTLTPEQLTSIHSALDSIATGTEAKFSELGSWLTSTFDGVFQRLGALESPPVPSGTPPKPPTEETSHGQPAGF